MSVYRVFKTAWFARAARKARIDDADLCRAVVEAALGQADDLGGGVFKKRLNGNRHRAILLANAGEYWVFTYLFAKQDRANIDDDELKAFPGAGPALSAQNARRNHAGTSQRSNNGNLP